MPLCAASAYFRDRLEATPANLFSPAAASGPGSTGAVVSLPAESPQMFELFVLWLYQRRAFKAFVDAAVSSATLGASFREFPNLRNDACRRALHWNLVRLHLFAAAADLPALQDAAMDALQDLYLRCDWEVSPQFVHFLYADCEPGRALRLRKWAVAMVAWATYGGGGEAAGPSSISSTAAGRRFQALFDAQPALWQDYAKHLDKMAESRADVRVKNPQLRLPGNRLRSEERFLGFRTCSFHSHRSTAGEGPCPLAVRPFRQNTRKSPWRRATAAGDGDGNGEGDGMESDDSEETEGGDILSAVSCSRWATYLDGP